MTTWGAGPFQSDAGIALAGEITENLLSRIVEFANDPSKDDRFDEAFAAIALINRILEAGAPVAVPNPDDARRWRATLLEYFDLQPDGEHDGSPLLGRPMPTGHPRRPVLATELDRFVALCHDYTYTRRPTPYR